MRQAGIIAAAGTYALKNNIERLKEDHARAKTLGAALVGLSYVKKTLPVCSNIVVFEVADDINFLEIIEKLYQKGIQTAAFGPQQIRLVTHLDISDAMLDYSIEVFQNLVL